MPEQPVGVNVSVCCGAPAILTDEYTWNFIEPAKKFYTCTDCWKPCSVKFEEAKE